MLMMMMMMMMMMMTTTTQPAEVPEVVERKELLELRTVLVALLAAESICAEGSTPNTPTESMHVNAVQESQFAKP